MGLGATELEAFAELRDRLNANDDEAQQFLADLPEAEVTKFLKEPQTERAVNPGISFFSSTPASTANVSAKNLGCVTDGSSLKRGHRLSINDQLLFDNDKIFVD